MVSLVAYKFGDKKVPAVDALKLLCDEIYLSYPRTKTMQRSGITERSADLVSSHNRSIRVSVAESLGKGGLLLAIAPSGSTDKLDADSKIRLGKVGLATSRMLQSPKTSTVPIAVWLENPSPQIEIIEAPSILERDDEVHSKMHKIAHTLGRLVNGKTFSYET